LPTPIELTRERILAFRRAASRLDARLPMGADPLRLAAWAGLQDSMPRAAVLSIHARVEGTPTDVLDDPTLTQVWGPRYSAYAVALADVPIFTLSRMPDDEKGRRRAEETADMLEAFLAGRRMKDREVYASQVGHSNSLRYATATGRVLIRWEGALAPWVWTVPRPEMSIADARREMARRYLHVFGPATAASFAKWAGISAKAGVTTFAELRHELIDVATPLGHAHLLAVDEQLARGPAATPAAARLLPSGDTYFLLWGRDRELLVPDANRRDQLWTTRVWPGALLVNNEIAGVWRRANEKVTVSTWRALSMEERRAVEAEAASLPLPGLTREIVVSWDD
jgi:hypothetical protein